MPRIVPTEELDAVIEVISRFPLGISVGEIMESAELSLPRRTLQRRLDRLVKKGQILPRGEGRGRRYVLAREAGRTAYPRVEVRRSTVAEPEDDREWLSAEAREIEFLINRPLSSRIPVGYKDGFLDAYQPNDTAYLSPELRRELAEMGRVGMTHLPAGTYVRQVLSRLLIDLSWNSSRLEGNTYSLLETQRLLEVGEMADGRAAEETQMILNHKAAIEMLADQAFEIGFNRFTICNLHALLSDNLLADPNMCGRLRFRAVGIGGSVFHPIEGPQRIEARFLEILKKAEAIEDTFEQAFFVMVHLPYLQPFEDVNKRVSRLAANIPLIRGNLCPLSFIGVEPGDYITGLLGVYELNRIEYLRDVLAQAYRRSCERYGAVRESLGEPDPFRLRYRARIGECVQDVVTKRISAADATSWVEEHTAAELPEGDRAHFVAVVLAELEALHIGNIARYRLRPSEFEVWEKGWR